MSTLTATGFHRGDTWKPKRGNVALRMNLRVIESYSDSFTMKVLVERLGGNKPFVLTRSQLEVAYEYAGFKSDPVWSR